MKSLILYRAMIRRGFIEMKRYAFDTFSGILTLFVFFIFLFYSAKSITGTRPGGGNTLSDIVVGYFVWSLSVMTFSALSQEMVSDAQAGTLEHLAMSPLGLPRVLFGSLVSMLAFQSVTMSVVLVAMMAVSGQWLHVDLVSVVPIVLLTLLGLSGMSYVLGGLAVVFKKMGSALQVLQIVLIAFIAVPMERYSFMKFLPLSWGNHLLTRSMSRGESFLSLAPDFGFLIVHSAIYLTFGIFIFKQLERFARSRGLLGHY